MDFENTSYNGTLENRADYIQEKVALNRKEVYEKALLGLFFTAFAIR